MKTLIIHPKGYLTEECCMGKIDIRTLPSQAIISAQYLKDNGFDVDFIDLWTTDENQIYPELKKHDIVVIWAALTGIDVVSEFFKKAKSEGKITILIMNELFGDLLKDILNTYPEIDYGIDHNERELSLKILIDCIENKKEIPSFSGIATNKKHYGKMPRAPDSKHLKSCSSILKTLPLKKYSHAYITTGKGCQFQCSFCCWRGTGTRKRRIEDVIDEIKTIAPFIKSATLIDEDLPSDRKWLDEFCDKLIAENLDFKWLSTSRADQCNLELLRKMKAAGCYQLCIGVETFSKKGLILSKKGITTEQIKAKIEACREVGITPYTTLMVGFPWDSDETLKETEDFLKKYKLTVGVSLVIPLQGTPLYDEFKRAGLLRTDLHYAEYKNWVNWGIEPYCETAYLSKTEIKKWQRRIQRTELNFKTIITTIKRGIKFVHFKKAFNILTK